MRVLFTAQPGAGHWRPLAPLAQALEQAGHEVAFAATPIFCQLIAEHGFQCLPVGFDDWTVPDPAPRAGPDLPHATAVYQQVFLPRSARHLPEVLALCRAWQPQVIVREQSEFAGYLAAELLGLPHVTVQVSALRPWLDQSLAPALDRLRADLGLPGDPTLARLYDQLLLLPFPPALLEPGTALPPSAHFIQHVPFDWHHSPNERLPDWVSTLPSQPTVLVTLGTAYSSTPGLLDLILAGLRDEPLNLIVTTNDRDRVQFGPLSPRIHLVPYLPQSLLMPHCQLVVTHGGSGTVRTTLSSGVPLVILPIAADQPENARRCQELGVARAIAPEGRTAHAVREASWRVLTDPSYRQRAQQLQAAFQALPKLTVAVERIEELAAAP